jgi:two-component system, chemotaxis family, protein-glutamate methylesterase/glutaminase
LKMAKTRVLIVDDSALIRNLMKEVVNATDDLETVGVASDPIVAREMIRNLNPDVLTLDIEMPKMDGLDFLERLMRLRPMPVVMVSTLTERGAESTLRALELGAVDFVAKPKLGIAQGMQECAQEIRDKIRAAACSRRPRPHAHAHAAIPADAEVKRSTPPPHCGTAAATAAAAATPSATTSGRFQPVRRAIGTEKIVAIGASTGGTEAIREVLIRMPADSPAIVITQHMPPGFTKSFAARLDHLCKVRVKEAEDGERLLPGHCYIAPGGRHLAVAKSGANYVAALSDAPPVNRHKPSVEVLFSSVAEHAGENAIGVMLTGMGKDGANAMLEMRHRGAFNLAQDEASCIVFGMPREAIAVGAVNETLGIHAIADRLMARLGEGSHRVRI